MNLTGVLRALSLGGAGQQLLEFQGFTPASSTSLSPPEGSRTKVLCVLYRLLLPHHWVLRTEVFRKREGVWG